MSVTQKQLDRLSVGDVIEATRTVRVVRRRGDGTIDLQDVHNEDDVDLYLDPDTDLDSSLRISMVKKAKRQFKEGDTITGRELKDHMWKRGTVIAAVGNPSYENVLHADGEWHNIEHNRSFSFDDFLRFPDIEYTIKRLP